jgi:uncharacterized membrane protein YkoI
MMIVVIAACVLSGCGVFDEHGHNRNTAMLQSKVSLAEAITIAEKETGGKAIRAGTDEEDGAILIKVSVAQNGNIKKVFLDPQTGAIVKTRIDEDND